MMPPSDGQATWHFEPLDSLLKAHGLEADASAFHNCLPAIRGRVRSVARHGDYPRWRAAVEAMPPCVAKEVDFGSGVVRIGSDDELDTEHRAAVQRALRALCPWRKGPFRVFGTLIDAEWQSDQKWARVTGALSTLAGRRVLDVGCGNGYYCLRALGAGARLVLGIDPSLLFVVQFEALRQLLPPIDAHVLPLSLEQLPKELCRFDTVLSLGVLYHRRAPLEHLKRLHQCLLPGGELALETLINEGVDNLVIKDRYASMRNVWCIPSLAQLRVWLEAAGFRQIRIADVTRTTVNEQRQTDWMTFRSLEHALDPNDRERTIEGYPSPTRATLSAIKPQSASQT